MPTTPQQTGFDVDAARKAGYSDDEIIQHLTQSRGFDVQSAIKAGYSKQEIITHLSSQQPQQAQQTQQAPSIPAPPKTERVMQQSMGGPPQFVDVPAGEGKQFEKAGQEGYQKGGKIGATIVGTAPMIAPLVEGGIAAAPAVARTALGSIAGGTAGAYTGGKIGGYFGEPGMGAAIGGTVGGLAGGYGGARGGTVKLPGPLGKLQGLFGGAEEGAEAGAIRTNPFEGATSTAPSAQSTSTAKLPPPSTTSTTSTGTAGLKATPPPSVQYVQKFGAPEKGIIVDPNAPPPPINKTLVSYDGKQLLEMAKKGDLDALNELIRNPRGINLREALPNAKFLMEPGRSTRIYGGPGSAKALLPAVGIVGAEFNKLGLADQVTPRQQTTLETAMRGPQWKDFDSSEKIEHIRDILGRK